MNIFALDIDPQIAASYHCDKHVVKMILESSQMMCTILHEKGINVPYRPTHRNHPCTKWAATSRTNFEWLVDLTFWLCVEYRKRYSRTHKCEDVLKFCSNYKDYLPTGELTSFVQAMPDQYKNEDPIVAYRNYYRIEKARMLQYKNTNRPSFLD